MSRTVKRHAFVCLSILVVAAVVIAALSLRRQPAGADTCCQANILLPVSIGAPFSGGTIYISGSVEGTQDYMQVWARSVTHDNLFNGGTPQWTTLNYFPNQPGTPGSFYGYLQAGYGDLIEVKARNWYYGQYNTDIEAAGYVPAGADSAPPEFNPYYIERTYDYGGTLSVTVSTYYGLYDPSYPITATLYDAEDPAVSSTVTFYGSYDYPKTLSISMSYGKIARLHAVDDYGNDTSMVLLTSQLGTPSPSGSFLQNPDAAEAEHTGSDPTAGIGVHLSSGSFVHSTELFHVPGRALDLTLSGTYRSRLECDGVLGQRWDTILDSRVTFVGNDIKWRPGNGREEYFTLQMGSSSYWWVSPRGLFVKAHANAGTVTITTPGGREYFYENNYLKEIRDAHGNKIQFVRKWGGHVIYILDDLGRRYDLYYYDHDRLAEIVDYQARSVRLGYDSGGHLTSITDLGG